MKTPFSPKDIVGSGLCIGCGSCVAQAASRDAHMKFDTYGQYKPYGPAAWLSSGPKNFSHSCPFSPHAVNEDVLSHELFPTADQIDSSTGRFLAAYVGHVSADDYRMQGSSGGLVTWVATELLRKGMVDGVAHVAVVTNPQTEGKFFRYSISRTEGELREGAKSRYYPVELSEVLQEIKNVPGRYAVIGIPCFIKAVQLLRREDPLFQERIPYTLGLFCGHMKSARFVESFAWQMKVPLREVKQVEFRHKDPSRPANWYNARLTLHDGRVVNKDWWHLTDGDWGAGYFMNSACNFCDDVVAETADISFGDAWVEPYSSDGRGTNVVIVRSPEVAILIAQAMREGRLNLTSVDAAFIERTQAAGFRQRREGLAYRLTWHHSGVLPRKRVAPDKESPTKQRKLIYWLRFLIAKWSHKVFWLARTVKVPGIYLQWARASTAVYHGWAYHKGKLNEMRKRFTQLKEQN